MKREIRWLEPTEVITKKLIAQNTLPRERKTSRDAACERAQQIFDVLSGYHQRLGVRARYDAQIGEGVILGESDVLPEGLKLAEGEIYALKDCPDIVIPEKSISETPGNMSERQ